MSASTSDACGEDSPQARLNTLFDSIRDQDGNRYSNSEIARRIGKTHAFIGMIRSGVRAPGLRTARDIERAFGLTMPYLLEDDPDAVRAVNEQLQALRQMREAGVLPLAMRAVEEVRTEEGRAAFTEAMENLIEHVVRMERRQRGGRAEDGPPDGD